MRAQCKILSFLGITHPASSALGVKVMGIRFNANRHLVAGSYPATFFCAPQNGGSSLNLRCMPAGFN
jgi:hypothetical protein